MCTGGLSGGSATRKDLLRLPVARLNLVTLEHTYGQRWNLRQLLYHLRHHPQSLDPRPVQWIISILKMKDFQRNRLKIGVSYFQDFLLQTGPCAQHLVNFDN